MVRDNDPYVMRTSISTTIPEYKTTFRLIFISFESTFEQWRYSVTYSFHSTDLFQMRLYAVRKYMSILEIVFAL